MGVLSSPRKTKALAKGRSLREEMLASAQKFASDWQNHIESRGGVPPAHTIFNLDESLIVAFEDRVRAMRCTGAGRARASVLGGRAGKTIGSLIAIVNAAGEAFLRILCLAAKFEDGVASLPNLQFYLEDVSGRPRSKTETRIMYSDTGFIDEEKFLKIVQIF